MKKGVKMSKVETIVAILDYEDGDRYNAVAGYEIVTTQQRIKLFIDDYSRCCEHWGYFWCNDNPQDFVGAHLRSVSITDTALNEVLMKSNGLELNDMWFRGDVIFVNVDTDRGVLQFVAYNEHNGYYGHTVTVQSNQLTHRETL